MKAADAAKFGTILGVCFNFLWEYEIGLSVENTKSPVMLQSLFCYLNERSIR